MNTGQGVFLPPESWLRRTDKGHNVVECDDQTLESQRCQNLEKKREKIGKEESENVAK